MSNYLIVAVLLLGALFSVTGCGGQTAGAHEGGVEPLKEESLKNTEYHGIYAETIRLTDGMHEGEPFVEGGASRPTVTFTGVYAFGDLNGDGVDDAVAVLVENSGGTGSFRYLAAVLNQGGSPKNVATYFLGDRGQVQSVSIAEGEITVDVVAHGPDDPMCCPSQREVQVYALRGDELAQLSSQVIGSGEDPDSGAGSASGSAAITGITWHWWGLVETDPAAQSVVPDPESYTLEFLADGTYCILADCNRGSGIYTVESESLTLLPGPMTRAYCGETSLDAQFLANLANVSGYALDGDRLILDLDGTSQMIFTRRVVEVAADITGITWRWWGLVETDPDAQSVVPNPENYTLTLQPDGTLNIKADCNMVGGSYTLEGDALTIALGPSTMAYCGDESLDQQYLESLGSVESYAVEDGRLVMYLTGGVGKMILENTGTSVGL
jgi:heat shock protein HslJ